MSDQNELLQQVQKAESRRVELLEQRATLEKTAVAHEEAARKIRNTDIPAIKEELQQLAGVLHNTKVQQRVASIEDSAKKTLAEAEQIKTSAEQRANEMLDRLAEKEKSLDELIAKASPPTPEPQPTE